VLGSPIAHSLSPALHRAAYAWLGLQGWTYEAIEVGSEGLRDFIDTLDASWAGLSLTMPLKAAVLPLLDEMSPLARDVGAVNTVRITPAAGPRPGLSSRRRELYLYGDNTDVPGFAAVLTSHGRPAPARPVILGAGNTAAAAVAALAGLGAPQVGVLARRPAAAADSLGRLADRLGVHLDVAGWPDPASASSVQRLLDADVVVATTPAGVCDGVADAITAGTSAHAGTPSAVGALGLLVDVVYAPWPTRLAVAWSRAGGSVASGLELLVEQAARQVPVFTGLEPPVGQLVAVMRAAGEAALGGSAGDPPADDRDRSPDGGGGAPG
jgi:shikimate dehydrogenase